MSCLPISWKRWKLKKTAESTPSLKEDKEEEAQETVGSSPSSPPSPDTGQPPKITLTTCVEGEEEEEEEDEVGRTLESRGGRKRGGTRLRHKMSVTSDGGYSSAPSQPSTSTLDVFRPRSLTESSNGSSSYHTPQGSVHNDPSPIGSGEAMPPFPVTTDTVTAVNTHQQMLEGMKEQVERLAEQVERLVEVVERLEASVSERLGGEKTERSGIQPVESMPDLTELPCQQCDTKVILWLVKKVTDWKFLARRLLLQEADISRIELDHPRSDREQCYQMFLKWKSVDPENYVYSVLGAALREESQELFNSYVKEVHRVEN